MEVYPGFAGKEVLYDWHGAVVGVATGGCVQIGDGDAEEVSLALQYMVIICVVMICKEGGLCVWGWLCLAVEARGSSSKGLEVCWAAAADGSLTAEVLQYHFELQSSWLQCP